MATNSSCFNAEFNPPKTQASLARRIVDRLSERYEIDHHLVEIGASIGIALTSPHVTADVLLKNADMALYRAKADGRGTFCSSARKWPTPSRRGACSSSICAMRCAHEEFELYYQPLVNLKSGRISTCEALLRWNHPTRGSVSPADIIPVVEDMGLVVDLGRWDSAQGVHGVHEVAGSGQRRGEFLAASSSISAMSSPKSVTHWKCRACLRTGWKSRSPNPPCCAIRNGTLDVLSQLRAAGVRISLDDFGTGYSSLSYLHNFPLQKVKIDRSFLEGIDTQRPLTLLRGVARLSADLGMSVVVEGIETNEQLELISAEGDHHRGAGLPVQPAPFLQAACANC